MGVETWRDFPHLADQETRRAVALGALREARRLIRGGWCQGSGSDGEGRFSLYGALQQTGEIEDEWAREVVRRFLPFPFIAKWNDDPRRRVDEVLYVLDRAIEACGGARSERRGGWAISTNGGEAWRR